ncbi:MAG: serine/threonine-protein kinase [Phycisphaerae bacterium]|nr:serine/threonine-protein kinase [Phycisphaerae bacterium]
MADSDAKLIAAVRQQFERADHGAAADGANGSSAHRPGTSGDASSSPGGNIALPELRNYRILRELQRGGQGVVYEGVQSHTQRPVAIKVIREGPLASSGDRIRFEREAQILAALRHPRIVTVLESGQAGGCEFFVMDLVQGPDLETYVRQMRPPFGADRTARRTFVRRVLELAARVCEAVHAAHLAGVVHRDLKPSNVRIGKDEQPFILDFGLAKRMSGTDGSSVDVEDLTMTGQFLGTLPYASPEQASGAVHVDTRTDVYSLGVMLYRLLTGRFPYDVAGPVSDVVSRIRNEAPQPPRELLAEIDTDAETVLLRALHKEPARRYENAGALASDLRRYLSGDAIEARRDSTAYVIRKHLERHKLAVGVGILTSFVILAALATSLYFWRKAAHERDYAKQLETAERQRAAELAVSLESEARERERAVRSAGESRAMQGFVLSLLQSANPELTGGRDLTVREMLDNGAAALLDSRLEKQPALQAAFAHTLADAYEALGADGPALRYYEQAAAASTQRVGPRDAETLKYRLKTVRLLVGRGRHRDAEALLLELGPIIEADDSLNWFVRGSYDLQRGILLREQGRLSDADAALQSAVKLFEEGEATSETMGVALNAIGVLRQRQRRFEEAESFLNRALAHMTSALGDRHPEVAVILSNLASCRYYLEDYEGAEPLYAQAYQLLCELYGEDHPRSTTVANNLCALLRKLKRLDDAEQFGRVVLERRRATLGADHLEVATSLNNLAFVYADQKRHDLADPLFREALAIREARAPKGHPSIPEARRVLGGNLARLGSFAEAEALLCRAYEEVSHLPEAAPAQRARCIQALVELYTAWNRPEDAAAWRQVEN